MDAGRGNDRRGRASIRARRVRVALIALVGVVACACALTGAHAGRVLGRRLLDVDDGEEARETSAMASKDASVTTSSVGTARAGETTKPTATVTEASAGDAEEDGDGDGDGDGDVKLELIPDPALEAITRTTEKDEEDEKPVVASVSSASSSKTTKVDAAADVEEAAKTTTASSAAPKATMVTVEDVDEEDPEDSITQGEGAKEVNEADEAFDSQPVEKTTKKSSSKSVDSARAAEGEAEKDTEGDVSAESEDDPEAATAALKEAMEKQLSTLYEEPTKKQKTWVERVKAIHEVEGATSFTESEEACGSTGGLAVFTIWGHVPDVVRDAITTFIGESASKSKSEFSLLSLRAKALQLVKAYDVTFKGTGAERTDCIANYFTRQKVHEVLAHIDRAKEEKVARAHETFDHTLLDDDEEDTSPEALKIRDLRIGRVSKEIKKTIMMTLAKAGISGGEEGEDGEEENVHGTAIVLALNCRAKHPHRLVAAVAHAIRAKFGLKVGDFSIVIGKKAVEDELTMLGASYASLMSERSNASPGAETHPAETKLCPELLGTLPPDDEEEPERELSAMEKAMLEAEEHVLLEHQGKDPTNPHHMSGGAGLSMGRLPGMPNVFDGSTGNDAKRGPNNAREQARAHFGLSDQQVGTHNTDYLRNPSRTYGARASSQPRQRVQGGFNALPKMTDPLDAYLKGDSRPKRYAEPTRA